MWASPEFRAERTLLKAVLAQMKLLEIQAVVSWSKKGSFDGLFLDFVLYAHRLEDRYGISDVLLMDEIDRVGGSLAAKRFQARGHWTNIVFESWIWIRELRIFF